MHREWHGLPVSPLSRTPEINVTAVLQCFVETSVPIGDDTKTSARRSPNCITEKMKYGKNDFQYNKVELYVAQYEHRPNLSKGCYVLKVMQTQYNRRCTTTKTMQAYF